MRILALLASAAVLTGAVLLLTGGRDRPEQGALVWAARPHVATTGGDRVLYGQVRNDGSLVLLSATRLRVLDAAGRELRSNGRFLQAFAPRRGRGVLLYHGRTVPLTIAWRGAGARRISMGATMLNIPR